MKQIPMSNCPMEISTFLIVLVSVLAAAGEASQQFPSLVSCFLYLKYLFQFLFVCLNLIQITNNFYNVYYMFK